MFCLQQHVFKLTKTGIFSELLPPSHRLPCRDIAAHMFHDLTLPGATWATPTNSRLCLETAQRVGDKSAPNCQSFLSIAEGALDTFSLFSPAPHPKTPSQASNHGQVLAPPGSQTKTLPEHCSAPLLNKLNTPWTAEPWNATLNLYQLKTKTKYSIQTFPRIPKNPLTESSCEVQILLHNSKGLTALIQDPNIFTEQWRFGPDVNGFLLPKRNIQIIRDKLQTLHLQIPENFEGEGK